MLQSKKVFRLVMYASVAGFLTMSLSVCTKYQTNETEETQKKIEVTTKVELEKEID